MKSAGKLRYLVSGVILGGTLFSGLTYAATTSNIAVSFDPVKFIINGHDKSTSDGNFNNQGTVVPASFIYEGTTYIPMRMVSNMLGKPVDWDGNTRSIIIGSKKGEGSSLTHMSPLKSQGTIQLNKAKVVAGQNYISGFSMSATEEDEAFISYVTNDEYKTFTGQIGLDDKLNLPADPKGYDVEIYAYYPNQLDTKKVLWNTSVLPGAPLQEFNVDITGTYRIGLHVYARTKTIYSEQRGAINIIDPYILK